MLLSATALVLTLTAASCDDAPEVTVAQVSRGTVSEVVEAPASVTARGAVSLTSPAKGTLAQLLVAPGATVAAGQTVAVIDSPEATARLAQAQAALDAAKKAGGGSTKVNLGGVQKALDERAAEAFTEARSAAALITDPTLRDKALAGITTAERRYGEASQTTWGLIKGVEKGISSLGQAMKALTQAQVMQAQQAFDLAKSNVDALTITAPFGGTVQLGGASAAAAPSSLTDLLSGAGMPAAPTGALPGVSGNINIGSPVTPGTAILTIVDTSELGLVAEVDETDILLVKPGLPADAELDAAPGAELRAEVTAIDLLPTANSRGAVAYKVHLVLKHTSVTPRPGMSALIRLKVKEAVGKLCVPAAAVFSADGLDTVWVKNRDGKAEKRRITTGVAGRDVLEITEGLREGETIVVKGADKVTEGDPLP